MKKGIMKAVEGLFQKMDKVEERYVEALERKQEQLIQLQLDLKEAEVIHAEFQKMKILGDISGEVYDAEARKVEALQKQIQEVQKEIQLIDFYKTDDVKAVLEELDAEKDKGNKEYNAELDKLKLELFEAKLVYLQKMQEAKVKYDELVAPERKMDQLKIQLGIKKNSYVSDSFEALCRYSIPNGGYEFLQVELNEVNDALRYGKVPARLQKLVQ